jgi:hypothetical protein
VTLLQWISVLVIGVAWPAMGLWGAWQWRKDRAVRAGADPDCAKLRAELAQVRGRVTGLERAMADHRREHAGVARMAIVQRDEDA